MLAAIGAFNDETTGTTIEPEKDPSTEKGDSRYDKNRGGMHQMRSITTRTTIGIPPLEHHQYSKGFDKDMDKHLMRSITKCTGTTIETELPNPHQS